ncbi:NAD(P)/FAD-dependent oxidoreductase [Desulfoferrobacter suflitae]|uniref:NAD(P)/FAD-dependent oxidoreductase n=1 Tax=Desulfoferrobacter suflitae TaxID=2865782 RepID=UPI002164656F|nr:FAD-dependent oxidoreductase [Desulfoferrobacter suflitae]MCK8603194.1 FAD-dependent oxidoreductase [Desulfoferrobacter suflitae]
MEYQVIIVGAGPAGIFAALTLAQAGIDRVLVIEQGRDLCDRQRSEDMLCGWGGAGAFSDGKLTLSPEVGGSLGDFIDTKSLYALLERADGIYVEHGAPDRMFGAMSPRIEDLADRARLADLELVPVRIRHIGTDNCRIVLDRLQKTLADRVEIRPRCQVQTLLVEHGRIRGVKLADGQILDSRFVIAAPGRSGASWMKGQAEALGLKTRASPVDIGVRVELPAVILKDITDTSYESKLIYYSKTFDDKVRTFCMNPYGEVVTEKNGEITTVNGHSYAERKSANTNFAILVSSAFTEPFDDPIAYGLYIARLANLLGKGAIIQRLGDLLAGRRSNHARIARCLTRPTLAEAIPGDLSFVFPYRLLLSIIEMLQALEKLAPGVYSRHTLLYGVEVKFYSNRIHVSREMETEVANLFAIGDGAGITRGLLQASVSGIMAGEAVASRFRQ